ncbi:MAG: DUF2341 domain-containing protein [Candidatus Solibacter sp.]
MFSLLFGQYLACAASAPTPPGLPLATPGIGSAAVAFTAPASDGGSPITSYTVTSNPGSITASGGTSPIVVGGLTNGVTYTFTVTVANAIGTSLASAASNTVIPSAPAALWFNPLWTSREPIAVAGSTAGAQTNYPVKLNLAWSAGMKTDFSDLRYTDSGGTQLLSYWVESSIAGVTAVIWVNVPSVPAAPAATTIYGYYGNPAAVSMSSGETTFSLFDTFGANGTPGDWNYTNNVIGEHAIIHNGKLYAPLYDSDFGSNGGLVVINPADGKVLKHFKIGGFCTAAAPAFDIHGYLHIYDCGGFIKKLDEDTGTVLATFDLGSALDWEAVPYDPVNDIVLVGSKDDHSLRALRTSNYSVLWRNTDVDLTWGSSEVDPPLIVGAYAYFQDYTGKLLKIELATGATAATTTATSAGLSAGPYPFESYSQIIYDAAQNLLYLTNAQGHTAFAVRPGDLSVAWSQVVEGTGWTFNRGGAYHSGVWYVTAREKSYPWRSKVYALNTGNSGAILWTNTTAIDNGAEISSILVDDNYVYAGTYDYVDQNYNKLLMLNVLDGSLATSIELMNGVASSIPTFYGGKIIMGLWYDTSGKQVGGYQALQVRDGGGTDDFYYKADLYQTGYVGAFASGPLTARTLCSYASLDLTRWAVTGLHHITNCQAVSTVNVLGWANSFKSRTTFSRAHTAIRVRSKNSEPNSNSWDSFVGFASVIGSCQPVCAGRNNSVMRFNYDQNGSVQTVAGPLYTADQYNTVEIKMAYPSLRFDVDDVNVVDIPSWSTALDTYPIQVGNFNGSAAVDWVAVRNYANPEPTPTVGLGTGLTVPSAPRSPVATAGNGQARVAFVPPLSNGGSPITGYTVTAVPGNITAAGSASPIIVPGLTNGLSYTFTVKASNATGDSPASPVSNAVIPGAAPVVTGQLTVVKSVVALNRLTGAYTQTVTVTNTGGALASAAYVLDGLPVGVTVSAADGATFATSPAGSPYRELGPLAAGAKVMLPLEFVRSATQAITYSHRVLGAGPR